MDQLPTLPTDCLNEIIEHLEKDKNTLHSCLLVNRLWCKISVRILWKDVWDYKDIYQQRSLGMATSILSTLVACLPNKSKENLHKNEITISTPTSKSPLFNYASFCQVLLICEIIKMVYNVLRDMPSVNSLSLQDRNCLVTNEIIKMFMNQTSLKKLTYMYNYYHCNLSFPYIFGVRNLSELRCGTNITSDFYYQLSQTCHNLQSISIEFHSNEVSNELKELISLQSNLKNLTLLAYYDNGWESIIPTITKHPNTLTKLHLCSDDDNLSLSFVSLFSNLQEIIFSFLESADFEDFKMLQFAKFPNLQILKIPYYCPKPEYIMNFLENNGKNLKNFYISENDRALSLSIANFCPNLKSLCVAFNNSEIDVLKTIFIGCQYLERIKVWCGGDYLIVKKVFETVANHASNNFCELKIYNSSNSAFISPEDLELFFVSWKDRTPKKLLTLIGINCFHYTYNSLVNEENMNIIKKYENLGIIKFKTRSYYEEGKEEECCY
ncbi:hypothetical protein RclHR1_17380003 [Rhizophagus clarus]|uniref:F-box domain-containing protein n=1 Tax=Rhizophagus clarus TaxID=94130 RepID=A0A2Z6R0D3_9GLOM|nr:hypothetical protein RclHR1_17380003 [Rhizophagus clarus]GES91907.1 hypothetical protein GLOIN_2v1876445 [Rhizophagus clarus]